MGTSKIMIFLVIYLYIHLIVGDTCPVKKFGDLCQYDCHCKNEDDCVTGECEDCVVPYSGETCQRENVAFHKPAFQSSNYSQSGPVYGASLAVDGNKESVFSSMGCSHTDQTRERSWWYVDLGMNYRIRYMRIYNRHEGYSGDAYIADRIMGFMIYVSREIPIWNDRDLCYEDTLTGHGLKTYNIECRAAMTGKFVGITLPKSEFLSLCEVEVYVCDDGWYGRTCNKECSKRNCNNVSDQCDIANGNCGRQGCRHGWKGFDCTCPVDCKTCNSRLQICSSCPSGSYGTRCNLSCDARRCSSSESSCPIEGECRESKCKSGWIGKDCACPSNCMAGHCNKHNTSCSRCQDNWYGPRCNKSCLKRKCKLDADACDDSNGKCDSGCRPGYLGADCLRKCATRCGECEQLSGICTKCKQSWYGISGISEYAPACYSECERRHCRNKNDPCPIDGTCQSGCEDGYSGKGCVFSCQALRMDQQCIVCTYDVCTKCDGAYYPSGRKCLPCSATCAACNSYDACSACVPGSYGSHCQLQCGANCLVINTTKPLCDKDTGSCFDGCSTGYYGNQCNKHCPVNCLNDTYIQKGSERMFYTNGGHGDGWHQQQCDQESGTCLLGCKEGFYGTTCEKNCSRACHRNDCNRDTARCTFGCITDWYGPTCEKRSDTDNSVKFIIVIVILTLVLVAVGITLVIIIWKWRKMLRETTRRSLYARSEARAVTQPSIYNELDYSAPPPPNNTETDTEYMNTRSSECTYENDAFMFT